MNNEQNHQESDALPRIEWEEGSKAHVQALVDAIWIGLKTYTGETTHVEVLAALAVVQGQVSTVSGLKLVRTVSPSKN